jgi:hypothetical protein
VASLIGEVPGVLKAADVLSPVHRDGHPGLDAPGRLGRLAGRHHVHAADWKEGDIDSGHAVHLGDHVRVAGMVEPLPDELDLVADPAGLPGVEEVPLGVALGGVVGGDCGDGDSRQELPLDGLARGDREHLAAHPLRHRRRPHEPRARA